MKYSDLRLPMQCVYQTRRSHKYLVADTVCGVGTALRLQNGRVLWMSLTKVAYFDDRYVLDGITHEPTFVIHTREEMQCLDTSSFSNCLAYRKSSAMLLLPLPDTGMKNPCVNDDSGGATRDAFLPCCVSVLDGEEATKEEALATSQHFRTQDLIPFPLSE